MKSTPEARNFILYRKVEQPSHCLANDAKFRRAAQIVTDRARSLLITTCQDFIAPAEAIWSALMFYEEVSEQAPFLLRTLVPTPIGTEGCKSNVGDEVKCHYSNGHLLKRVTRIVHGRTYSFEVIEQDLALRGGIRVLGGDYMLHHLSPERTRVALSTRYESRNRPRWLFYSLEATVCHSFHRHILTAMRKSVGRTGLGKKE